MVRPALLAALALLVVAAGCSANQSAPVREDRAVAALEDARTAVDEVETYHFDGTLRVAAEDDGATRRVTIGVAGRVDVPAKRATSTAERDGRVLGSFLLDRTRYRECPRPRGSWEAENATVEGEWASATPLQRQLALLDSGDLRIGGTGTVRGENATILVGEPTASGLRQFREDRSRPLLGGPEIRNPTVRLWLDDETSRPLRSTLTFEVAGDGGTATAEMAMRFTRYGEPVSIDLPPEVEEHTWETGCPGT